MASAPVPHSVRHPSPWTAARGLAALLAAAVGIGTAPLSAAEPAWKFRTQELDAALGIGYAVTAADVDGDGRKDLVVVDMDRVVWYHNDSVDGKTSWKKRSIIQGGTERDNVCIGAYDVDQDGKLDFALGAHWQPKDTLKSGSLQWLKRGATLDEPWSIHFIDREPTIHRLRWIDLDADGRAELTVLPLFGRGSKGPDFQEAPLKFLSYKIPKNPTTDRWPRTVLNEELHVAHNYLETDLDKSGKLDLLAVSFEGVSLFRKGEADRWTRTLIGSGNQATKPNRGASEIKHAWASPKHDYIATIEPWHGTQVVVYTRPAQPDQLWERKVLDEELHWGHAVWCADLDGDGGQELVIGVRDHKSPAVPSGVRIYKPSADAKSWTPYRLDPGGVCVEDLIAEDLDSDGDVDLAAVGRQTKNLRIYWNETVQSK